MCNYSKSLIEIFFLGFITKKEYAPKALAVRILRKILSEKKCACVRIKKIKNTSFSKYLPFKEAD